MDASSAAAWSWPRIAGPIIKNRHTADSFITPTAAAAAAAAAAAVQVVHKNTRKAAGPPPLESRFFKKMCRRTSANNNNNNNNNNNTVNNNVVVVAAGKYFSTSEISPAYRTAATATSASAMETLLADHAATPPTSAASPMATRPADRAAIPIATAAAFNMETLPAYRATATATMQTLPIALLRQIGAFAGECFPLGETSRANLEVTNELHYAINIMNNASSFSPAVDPSGALSNRHMGVVKPPRAWSSFREAVDSSGGGLSNRHMGVGVKPPGALATGRIVTRITVTGCTDLKDTNGGYQVLEEAVKRVVQHSIPTLRSIAVKGRRSRDSPRVASILSDLASLAANRNRVAPNLVRVELNHGATAFSAAGKAIEAGLWPALEELIVPNCHAKLAHARKLVSGLGSGRAANLRVLVWDEQASAQHEHLDNAILSALSAGRCPRIERLSFANPKIKVNPSYTLLNTILACPDLRELRLTRKSMSTQRVFYVTCRASRLQTFRQKLATARTKRLSV